MFKFLKKIKNIITGWLKKIFNANSELSKKRLEVCDKCPHKVKILRDDYCGLCYCNLHAKSLVEDEICYDGRWNDIKTNEYDKEF